MQRKTKINVLLPIKMVGELENLSRLGKRSEFIQTAIRNKLDLKDEFSAGDLPSIQLLTMLQNRNDNDLIEELLSIVRRLMK